MRLPATVLTATEGSYYRTNMDGEASRLPTTVPTATKGSYYRTIPDGEASRLTTTVLLLLLEGQQQLHPLTPFPLQVADTESQKADHGYLFDILVQ